MIDIKNIKDQLMTSPEHHMLLDGGYLDMDLQKIFQYYQEVEPDIEFFKKYSETHDKYDFMEFSKCYLENLIGLELEFSYTEDGWLELQIKTNI